MTLRALVFLAAFLLFAAEPLSGRLILPSAGGGAHVWATALMFFQGALLLGYLYAHWVAPRIGRWHLLVACVPLALMPLSVEVSLDPAAPVWSVFAALATRVAPAFVVLATTSVLAQRWLAGGPSDARANPYPLYGVSNAGSLLALLIYPLVISPFLSLRAQAWVWSAGYVGFLALLWRSLPAATGTAPAAPVEPEEEPVRWHQFAVWLVLAAAPSALLLAVTNVIEQDVGSAPLVWVVPLAIYIASFVAVFRERPLYPRLLRRFWLEIAAVGLLLFYLEDGGLRWWSGTFQLAVLLAICLAAHAALYRTRPRPRRLTTFYVAIAVGGWAGAAFVTLAAPRLFVSIAEYPIAIGVAIAAVALARRSDLVAIARGESRILLAASLVFFAFVAHEALARTPQSRFNEQRGGRVSSGVLETRRNAYGIYRVTWQGDRQNRTLRHGTTIHGRQDLTPRNRRQPAGYYAVASPLGDVFDAAPRPHDVAVIGLGAGAAAAHLNTGDSVTFYELDPDVVDLARTYFTYLEDTPADVRIVVGDARVQLASDESTDGKFTVLFVDAFSSDAIPTHLITREAVQLFLRKLKPDGYLVFHISNRHHDLRPVLQAIGESLGLPGAFRTREHGLDPLEMASTYFVLVRDPELLRYMFVHEWTAAGPDSGLPRWEPWTDDHVNLLQSLLE